MSMLSGIIWFAGRCRRQDGQMGYRSPQFGPAQGWGSRKCDKKNLSSLNIPFRVTNRPMTAQSSFFDPTREIKPPINVTRNTGQTGIEIHSTNTMSEGSKCPHSNVDARLQRSTTSLTHTSLNVSSRNSGSAVRSPLPTESPAENDPSTLHP